MNTLMAIDKNNKIVRNTILWQIPIESEKDCLTELFRLDLDDPFGQLLQVLWDTHSSQRFALIGTKGICFYLSPSLLLSDLTDNKKRTLNIAKWNPHSSEIAIGFGQNIYGLDSRDSQIRFDD